MFTLLSFQCTDLISVIFSCRTPCKINPAVNSVLSARKPCRPEQTPLKMLQERMQLQTQEDGRKREQSMYCRELLYSGASEFCFEELRAERYRQKHAVKLQTSSGAADHGEPVETNANWSAFYLDIYQSKMFEKVGCLLSLFVVDVFVYNHSCFCTYFLFCTYILFVTPHCFKILFFLYIARVAFMNRHYFVICLYVVINASINAGSIISNCFCTLTSETAFTLCCRHTHYQQSLHGRR